MQRIRQKINKKDALGSSYTTNREQAVVVHGVVWAHIYESSQITADSTIAVLRIAKRSQQSLEKKKESDNFCLKNVLIIEGDKYFSQIFYHVLGASRVHALTDLWWVLTYEITTAFILTLKQNRSIRSLHVISYI